MDGKKKKITSEQFVDDFGALSLSFWALLILKLVGVWPDLSWWAVFFPIIISMVIFCAMDLMGFIDRKKNGPS